MDDSPSDEGSGSEVHADEGSSTHPPAPRSRPSSVVVVAIGVVLLLLLALVVDTRPGLPVATFPSDTPAGTLQEYLRAMESRDASRAWELLSVRARREQLMVDLREQLSWTEPGEREVTLLDADESEDVARLHISIIYVGGPGIVDDGWSTDQVVTLVRDTGAWRIDVPQAGWQP